MTFFRRLAFRTALPTALLPLALFLLPAPAIRAQEDPEPSAFRATVLLRDLANPTSMTFLPDGRVYVTRKNGEVLLHDPGTGQTVVAAMLPAVAAREDGLHALVLDPAFSVNRRVYALTSERSAGDTAVVVLRYTAQASGLIDTSTRATLLRVPYTINSNSAEHNTGTLAFGPDGNLFVALADNTQNIFSGTGAGYSPRDATRPLYDARRSAANTDDLRGKILRIRPADDGTYTIPEGNLFPPGTPDTRPEIYVMGVRHPFRITVDALSGRLYWAEPGPNASNESATFGPRGYEEINMAATPGNYGWPFCLGNDFCYREYDYQTNTPGATYVPDSLRNTSPHNTGLTELPPARPAMVWYAYNNSTQAFPVFGGTGGSNAGMLGPLYRYADTLPASRLPSAFHRNLFIVEWQRNLLFAARTDGSGAVTDVRPFRDVGGARDSVVNGPIDVKIGPDGTLYFLNWGSGTYPSNSGNGSLVRYAYEGPHVPAALDAEPVVRGRAAAAGLFAATGMTRFELPAGVRGADVYALDGTRVWRYRRADASRSERVELPAGVRGVVRIRLLP